ncbi:uncharacterized protein [Argopecten irradians]|uniref:uncharacterized protein n=1 Tax=Argopecten irradians TaxID=31199 RepID=UPI00371155DB
MIFLILIFLVLGVVTCERYDLYWSRSQHWLRAKEYCNKTAGLYTADHSVQTWRHLASNDGTIDHIYRITGYGPINICSHGIYNISTPIDRQCMNIICNGMSKQRICNSDTVLCYKDNTTSRPGHPTVQTSPAIQTTDITSTQAASVPTVTSEGRTTSFSLTSSPTNGVKDGTSSHSSTTSDVTLSLSNIFSEVTPAINTATSDVNHSSNSTVNDVSQDLNTMVFDVTKYPNDSVIEIIPKVNVSYTCEELCYTNRSHPSQTELRAMMEELTLELAINKTTLSSRRRQYISVYDSRPTSVAMGGVAVAFLITCLCVIAVPDIISLVRYLQTVKVIRKRIHRV